MTTAPPPARRPRPGGGAIGVAASPATDRRPPAWAVVPLALVLAYVLSFTVRATALRLGADWPLSPWESGLVVDGWRAATGQRVYAMPADGPATAMYGPLGTYLVGAAFRATGPNLWVPRAIPLALSLAACGLAGAVVGRRSGWVAGLIAAAVVAAAFFKAQAAMTRARPDAASVALSLAALVLLYQGHRPGVSGRRWAWTVGGSVTLVVAFLFKQPAAVLAGVPLLAEAGLGIARGRVDWRAVGRACVPVGAVAATLVAIKLAWPVGWFYLVEVAGLYGYQWPLLFPRLVVSSLQYAPLAIAAVAYRAASAAVGASPWGRLDAWCVAALAVTWAFGTLAWAKVGGGVNSLLPFFVAGAFYFAATLPEALRRLPALPAVGRAAAVGAVAVLLVTDLLGVRKSEAFAREVVSAHGDATYRRVIRTARTLPGRVICPLDPTVELFASGAAGRNLWLETDAAGDRRFRPPTVVREVLAADWVIHLQTGYQGVDVKGLLTDCGYKRQRPPPGWAGSVYVLYRRVGPPTDEMVRLASGEAPAAGASDSAGGDETDRGE